MVSDTILVVDDETDLVQGLRRTLSMEIDCRVLTAENGVQALDILSNTAVDVVLAEPYQDLKEKAIESFTLAYLDRLLGRTEGNVSAAAKLSGMKRQSLQKIIKRYGIDMQQLRS